MRALLRERGRARDMGKRLPAYAAVVALAQCWDHRSRASHRRALLILVFGLDCRRNASIAVSDTLPVLKAPPSLKNPAAQAP